MKEITGGLKLWIPEEEIEIHQNKYSKDKYFFGPTIAVSNIGLFSLEGDTLSPYQGLHYVLSENSLVMKTAEEIIKERENYDIYHISLNRPILFDDPNESRPTPLVIMTVDGYDFLFSGKLLLGNPDLPEESKDFIEEWWCLNSDCKDVSNFYIRENPELIHLLNFRFSFSAPIPLLFSR